jgi:hypothetical protein
MGKKSDTKPAKKADKKSTALPQQPARSPLFPCPR